MNFVFAKQAILFYGNYIISQKRKSISLILYLTVYHKEAVSSGIMEYPYRSGFSFGHRVFISHI